MIIARDWCGRILTCDGCKEEICAGCGREYVLNIGDGLVTCAKCLGPSILEFAAKTQLNRAGEPVQSNCQAETCKHVNWSTN